MRTDCTRDNRKCILRNAYLGGFNRLFAKRGNWIRYKPEPGCEGGFGRVIGRVHADGKTYLEIVALLGNLNCPAIRWIEPESVLECTANPPRRIFDFMCGDWTKPDAIFAAIKNGWLSDSYLDEKQAEKTAAVEIAVWFDSDEGGFAWDDSTDHGGFDRISPQGYFQTRAAAEADAKAALPHAVLSFVDGQPAHYLDGKV